MTNKQITEISIQDYEAWVSWKQGYEIPGYCIVRLESAEPGYCGTVDLKWHLIDNVGFKLPTVKTNYRNIDVDDSTFKMFKQVLAIKLKSFKKIKAA